MREPRVLVACLENLFSARRVQEGQDTLHEGGFRRRHNPCRKEGSGGNTAEGRHPAGMRVGRPTTSKQGQASPLRRGTRGGGHGQHRHISSSPSSTRTGPTLATHWRHTGDTTLWRHNHVTHPWQSRCKCMTPWQARHVPGGLSIHPCVRGRVMPNCLPSGEGGRYLPAYRPDREGG